MHKVYEVHTWDCSIPDCKERLTGASDDNYAAEQGWENQLLYGVEFDLCPVHSKELRSFLFDDDSGKPE
jgi:hypothetical protein